MNNLGKKRKAIKLLKSIKDVIPDHSVGKNTIIEDLLKGKTNADAIKAVFMPTDENRKSILEKQEKLKSVIKKYPTFRAALLHLSTTYLQLGRTKEAQKHLNQYYKIDDKDPIVNYYLSIIAKERYDYNLAWYHLNKTKQLLLNYNHRPKALEKFSHDLRKTCPPPLDYKK